MNKSHWSTEDEIKFLAGLGTHRDGRQHEHVRGHVPRCELLERYETAMAARVEWGDVDPAEVSRALAAMIAHTFESLH